MGPPSPGDGEAVLLDAQRSEHQHGWERVIDRHLAVWTARGVGVDDDLIPPTPQGLRTARAVATVYLTAGVAPPTHVVPNGDGGVTFERRDGTTVDRIEALFNGDAEWTRFEGGTLVHHNIERAPTFV